MSNKIKKIKDDMSESIYQIDDGKNQFNLHVPFIRKISAQKISGTLKSIVPS